MRISGCRRPETFVAQAPSPVSAVSPTAEGGCATNSTRKSVLLCVSIQQSQRPQHRVPGDLKALWTQLVERVFRRVVEGVVVTVVKIDEVHYGNANFLERKMVILDRR